MHIIYIENKHFSEYSKGTPGYSIARPLTRTTKPKQDPRTKLKSRTTPPEYYNYAVVSFVHLNIDYECIL